MDTWVDCKKNCHYTFDGGILNMQVNLWHGDFRVASLQNGRIKEYDKKNYHLDFSNSQLSVTHRVPSEKGK